MPCQQKLSRYDYTNFINIPLRIIFRSAQIRLVATLLQGSTLPSMDNSCICRSTQPHHNRLIGMFIPGCPYAKRSTSCYIHHLQRFLIRVLGNVFLLEIIPFPESPPHVPFSFSESLCNTT